MSAYMDAYEAIKSLPVLKEFTEYGNTENGETKILILNEAIWMDKQMEHTHVKPN